MPSSYRIAVVGFPESGKTTLITAVFAFLFRRGIKGASIVPRGEETIKRINENMEQLELGRPLGRTKDQDVFAYRAEVKLKSFIVPRHYKLEIGDFPGENSVAFAEEYGDWLHLTRYFEWAISADAFLFVVDTGRVLLDDSGEYVAGQKRALRAAWQRLQEYHLEGAADVRTKPLVLIFAKADLLLVRDSSKIRELAFGQESPPLASLDTPKSLNREVDAIIERFGDLIEYFERENRRFDIVFASVFINVKEERLGIPRIARFIMPSRKGGGIHRDKKSQFEVMNNLQSSQQHKAWSARQTRKPRHPNNQ